MNNEQKLSDALNKAIETLEMYRKALADRDRIVENQGKAIAMLYSLLDYADDLLLENNISSDPDYVDSLLKQISWGSNNKFSAYPQNDHVNLPLSELIETDDDDDSVEDITKWDVFYRDDSWRNN